MWPEPGEALSRTIDAERAIEDLYAEALRRWLPTATPFVLPALTAATLPPDPDGVSQAQSDWEQIAEQVVIAGVVALWAASYLEAADGIGVPLPDLPDLPAGEPLDPDVARIVARATGRTPAVVDEQVQRVQAAAGEKVAEFAAQQRPVVAATPALIRDKVDAAIINAAPPPPEPDAPAPPVTVEDARDAAEQVMQPASTEVRDIARRQGYQAAGVMNNAVLQAAVDGQREDDPLDAVWLATLDQKTRSSHWAAWGERVPVGTPFTVGGEQLMFPGDPNGSPAETYNCRCRLGILGRDEPLPDETDTHTERLNGRDSVAINRDGRTQAEEIQRRRDAGNVRARDTGDGVGRVAAVAEEQDMDLDVVDVSSLDEAAAQLERFTSLPTVVDEPEPDFAAAITSLTAASVVDEPRVRTYDPRLFDDPKLTGPTAPTMNNETGRIYGHLAEWGHTIRGGRDMTPRNRNGYRNFHTSQVQLDNGKHLSVGRLTVQGGHAATDRGVTAAAARAHYDDVTKAFGLVRVGEDRFGIWFSGVPAPGVDPDVFQQGMTAALSGDWRYCDGQGLDMIAAHAVNSPGFPIYSALTGPDGRDLALVASLGPVRRASLPVALTADDVKTAVAEALAEERRTAALAARRDAALTAATALVGDPPAPLTPAEKVEEILAHHNLTASFTAAVGTRMPPQLVKFWTGPEGRARIGWGRAGDFSRCRNEIQKAITKDGDAPLPPNQINGLCATLHKLATGARPGHAPGEGGKN